MDSGTQRVDRQSIIEHPYVADERSALNHGANADSYANVNDLKDDKQPLPPLKRFALLPGSHGERYIVQSTERDDIPPQGPFNPTSFGWHSLVQWENDPGNPLDGNVLACSDRYQTAEHAQSSNISTQSGDGQQETSKLHPSIHSQLFSVCSHCSGNRDPPAALQASYYALSRWEHQPITEEPFPLAVAASYPPLFNHQNQEKTTQDKSHSTSVQESRLSAVTAQPSFREWSMGAGGEAASLANVGSRTESYNG